MKQYHLSLLITLIIYETFLQLQYFNTSNKYICVSLIMFGFKFFEQV